MAPLRITHVITALTTGGAETMLWQVLARQVGSPIEAEVIALSGGPVKDRIEALGVPVTVLGMPRGLPSPSGLWRLVRHLRLRRPDVVQSWLYHADLAAGVAGWLAGRLPVIWGIHNTTLSPAQRKPVTVWTRRLCARLSHRLPRRIVCCSEASRQCHAELGYDTDRMVVIPNGFDLERFHPAPERRAEVRAELGLPTETPLVGLVARFDPQKDHRNFLQAARLVHQQRPEVRFVLCGREVTRDNPNLRDWLTAEAVEDCCLLLGPRDDIPRLTAALDLACSSSVGEALPMALGEALATGVPCVATDVGDSSRLVGNAGRIVPPQDPVALAAAMLELLAMTASERLTLGLAGRTHIAQEYELGLVVSRYEALWRSVAGMPPPADNTIGDTTSRQ